MFTADYKHIKEGVVTGISTEGFEKFLLYIYTGKIQELAQHAKELLIVADKYEIDDLKTVCEIHLLSNLTEDIATEIFMSAHKFRCSVDLKKASFEYIKK